LTKLPVTENDVKSQVKQLLAIKNIFNYHLLQGMGAYKGVPDRVLHYKGRVIYLEIKKPGGKMSPHQIVFMMQCMEEDIPYWCIDDIAKLDELLEAVE